MNEGAVACLGQTRVFRPDVVLVPEFEAVVTFLHRLVAPAHPFRRHQTVVVSRPALAGAAGAIADPNDVAGTAAQRGGEPVDVRYDLARHRHFALMARLDEIVLHVDDQEGSAARLDASKGCSLPTRVRIRSLTASDIARVCIFPPDSRPNRFRRNLAALHLPRA